MYINTYELEKWGDGHSSLVAQDVQRAHISQALFIQRLSQIMISVGQQISALGQQRQMPEDLMQLQN